MRAKLDENLLVEAAELLRTAGWEYDSARDSLGLNGCGVTRRQGLVGSSCIPPSKQAVKSVGIVWAVPGRLVPSAF